MPSSDISKCATADNCPKRDKCWRHLAPDHELQSYTTFWNGEDECEWFWKIDDDDKENL